MCRANIRCECNDRREDWLWEFARIALNSFSVVPGWMCVGFLSHNVISRSSSKAYQSYLFVSDCAPLTVASSFHVHSSLFLVHQEREGDWACVICRTVSNVYQCVTLGRTCVCVFTVRHPLVYVTMVDTFEMACICFFVFAMVLVLYVFRSEFRIWALAQHTKLRNNRLTTVYVMHRALLSQNSQAKST